MNLYALSYIGIQLERRIGSFLFLSGYLLCGIFASACSLWWHDGSVNSAGASGAIFGLFGIFYSLLFTNLFGVFQKGPLFQSFLTFLGLNLFIGMAGNIDNSAHLGGLIFGLFCGLIYYPVLRRRVAHLHGFFDMEPKLGAKLWPWMAVIFLAFAAFIGSYALIDQTPKTCIQVARHLETVDALETEIIKNAERFDSSEDRAEQFRLIRLLITDAETLLRELDALQALKAKEFDLQGAIHMYTARLQLFNEILNELEAHEEHLNHE